MTLRPALGGCRVSLIRLARGTTQADRAREASVTPNYVGKLENAGAAPGIDLVERLATALGASVADFLPASAPPDPPATLMRQARHLFDRITDDDQARAFLVPLLARLLGGPGSPKYALVPESVLRNLSSRARTANSWWALTSLRLQAEV